MIAMQMLPFCFFCFFWGKGGGKNPKSHFENSGSQMNRFSVYFGTTRFYSGPISEILPKAFAKVA